MSDKADALKARFAAATPAPSGDAKLGPISIDDRAIEQLQNDARQSAWLTDSTVQGFKVRKQGQRLTFNFIARNPDGTVVNVTIGRVGIISLHEARESAREMRRQIADGLCPAQEKEVKAKKQTAQRASLREAKDWTVRKAIESKQADPSLRQGSKDNYSSLLNVSLKKLADRRLDDIERAEWKQLLDGIKQNVSAAQAAKVRAMTAALYRHANATSASLKLDNPLAELVVKLDDGSGGRRQNRLEEDSLHQWTKGLRRFNRTVQNLALFTLMTAMREAEARLLRWDEIKGDDIVLPAGRTKVRKPLKLPITNAMWTILERQRGKSNAWVFPSPVNRKQPISPILPQLKELGSTAHDLRRTALSIIDSMGVPHGVRRAIANHAAASIADGYVIVDRDDIFRVLTDYHERLSTAIQLGAHLEMFPDALQDDEAEPQPPSVWQSV